ncbi:hypothetical protein PCASD_15856 [Puccinia coronata f. sp. avenae]|uniref:Uncharacterized protein n=1 Tax=Puccinia coronata f. sp. avenae TaxID=200324 RepID=A0A2N5SSC3_9BASI|nr:hypothetical protein PCASD_15856 [Puccinia coronata f. sp. avenae]
MDTANGDLNPPAASQGQRNLKTSVGKILSICDQIAKHQLDPKKFILGFLTLQDTELAYKRRFWGTPDGITSTVTVLNAIRDLVVSQRGGQNAWTDFILQDVNARGLWVAEDASELVGVNCSSKGLSL